MNYYFVTYLIFQLFFYAVTGQTEKLPSLKHVTNIEGGLSPKSVVHNSKGLFFAQNMMYKHTITVYNRNFELVKTIKDEISLNEYGHIQYKGKYKGAPVECTFSHNGLYAWVSNYLMTGGDSLQFKKPGCDGCSASNKYDSSFVYKINTSTFTIEAVIKVGAVPKYLAASPDNSKVLVTNWSSGDMSIIDTEKNKEVKRIKLGTYPRGIAISTNNTDAYVAVMGSNMISKVNIKTYEIQQIRSVGKTPRHLCLTKDNKHLYISFNGEASIGKLNLETQEIEKLKVGNQPRSMILSDDEKSLFVVNYADNTFSKIATSTMTIVATTKTKHHPIGITYDAAKEHVWVACYSGYLQVFKDSLIQSSVPLLVQKNIRQKKEITKKEPENLAIAQTKTTTNKKPIKETKNTAIVTAQTSTTNKTSEINTFPTEKNTPQGNFYIVVGAFSVVKNAEKLVKEYQQKGYPSFVHYNNQKGLTYCVIQSFETIDIATQHTSELATKGISGWIYKVE